MRFSCRLAILLGILQPALTFVSVPGSFSRCPSCTQRPARTAAANRCLVPQAHRSPRARGLPALRGQEAPYVAKLDDEKVEKLWAWLCRAFVGDRRYNNLILAFGAVFGDDAEDAYLGEAIAEIKSRPGIAEAMDELVEAALLEMPSEETAVGGLYSLRERERGCLGAMGAGQWTGQWRTRPHALLDVRNLTCVEDWVKTLPRGARRTLAKADAQNFTVVALPITGMEPAPHSTLAHFRCVIEHEVRLLATSPDDFFEALQHGIGRYQNCITQGGEIREYRDEQGRVLAFAQEVTKGKVMRGQWFYSTDAGAKRFVWFHSVKEMVRRSIEDPEVNHADLGPSGSDSFSQLKEKYGFASVADWHKVADYRGPFRYSFGEGKPWKELDPPDHLFEPSVLERMLGADPRNF